MTWKLHVLANARRRLLSRILQVLESQMVSIHSLASAGGETEEVAVIIVFSSEEDKTYRIKALLHGLDDVRSVSVLAELEPRQRPT